MTQTVEKGVSARTNLFTVRFPNKREKVMTYFFLLLSKNVTK